MGRIQGNTVLWQLPTYVTQFGGGGTVAVTIIIDDKYIHTGKPTTPTASQTVGAPTCGEKPDRPTGL